MAFALDLMDVTYRLVALDLDDTLLGHDGAVSPRNIDAVRRLTETGVTVVLASGRRLVTMQPFCDPLGLSDPLIAYNGALACWPARDETIHHLRLPPDVATHVVRFAAERGCHLNYYLDETIYVSELNEWTELFQTAFGAISHPVGDLCCFDGREPTKVILMASAEAIAQFRVELDAHHGGRVSLIMSPYGSLEVLPQGVDKAFALAAVGRRLGIAAHEMVAIGDGANDIAMLEYVGQGIAMGNAAEDVRRAAAWVTATNAEDGVAQAIAEVFGVAG